MRSSENVVPGMNWGEVAEQACAPVIVFAIFSVGLAVAGCRPSSQAEPFLPVPAPEPPPLLATVHGLGTCTLARSADPIPQRRSATTTRVDLSFDDVVTSVDLHCGKCHLDPANQGAFSYRDLYAKTDPKDTSTVPLLPEVAQKMASSILTPATEAQRMPPATDNPDPAASLYLGRVLLAWVQAGLPPADSHFPPPPMDDGADGGAPTDPNAGAYTLSSTAGEAMTNLGNCIPSMGTRLVGTAMTADRDALFEQATELPKTLTETDMTTLDTKTLAEQGVVAFAPAYPLWADDARNVRMVRVPSGQQIVYDAASNQFKIPPNTRFYDTFFKKVVEADGHVGYRKMETRLIVSRPAEVDANGDRTDTALFGSYLWNDTETEARLIEEPYRNGKPFKDHIFNYLTDETSGTSRTYAVPGADRCIQCHMGSEMHNFVLGFTPLQINRRPQGEGGVIDPVGDDELTQVERLLSYGVLTGFQTAADLPLLEDSAGDRRARNVHELRAQAYMAGNCAHCHNPDGFPVQDDSRLLRLNLRPGGVVFQFPLELATPDDIGTRYVSPLDLDIDNSISASLIYQRIATPMTTVKQFNGGLETLLVPHMPQNTPGLDCRAPQLLGRWISSIPLVTGSESSLIVQDAEAAAALRVAQFDNTFNCNQLQAPLKGDVVWLDKDLTDSPVYVPRREDWADPTNGVPQQFRDMRIDQTLADVALNPYPYGYWDWKPQCQFPPDSQLPTDEQKPWMFEGNVVGGQPVRPLGEVFLQTPGEAIFLAVCAGCHGDHAEGDGDIADALAQLSGGQLRVSNLLDGLFGPHDNPAVPPGANLRIFAPLALPDERPEWGAAKYLVWMGSGGTKVKFPAGFEFLLGNAAAHGGNMLTRVRTQCSRLLPQSQIEPDDLGNSLPFSDTTEQDFWQHMCAAHNPIPAKTASAQTFEAWKEQAQSNGGIMMFFFFEERAANNLWPVPRDSCEDAFPASGP